MLQQTQVSRVVPHYVAWVERWPTVCALAEASAAEVIRAWAGLGYNRRALRLREAAVAIVSDHRGAFPTDVDELRALPGVGAYTASAIACFAGESRVPVVDTNIARVLARSVFGVATARVVSARRVDAAAEASLPRRFARRHNLALMDLGATVCQVKKPDCEFCPLRVGCEWRALGYPDGPTSTRSNNPRFEDTPRFARGRIVDRLRHVQSLSPEQLKKGLPKPHHMKLDAYLSSLERDGLIERCAKGWRLPNFNG